ncbi:MAG: hypothetical protein KF898_08500 [Parachlamydiales bacterium]|nr:hypothetical protein [Candidatus Acheromyda pituitae]
MSITESNFTTSFEAEFQYFFIDGIISRYQRETQKVEVCDFKSCIWKPTANESLIRKMMQGKGIVKETEVNNLFLTLRRQALAGK